MARITLGSGISSINGSIGGTTYQNSNSGTIAKNKGVRTQKSSYQSDKSKSTIAYINQLWSNLGVSDRLDWQNLSVYKPTAQKHNSGRFLNGQQLYVKYNYAYYTFFSTTVDTPPFLPDPVVFRELSVKNNAGQLIVVANDTIDENFQFIMFKISSPVKQGRKSSVNGSKFIKLLFNGTDEVNITSAYQTLFGAVPSINQYVVIEYQVFNKINVNFNNQSKLVTQVIAY